MYRIRGIEYMTQAELMSALCVSRNTVQAYYMKRGLKRYLIDGDVCVRVRDVDKILRAGHRPVEWIRR